MDKHLNVLELFAGVGGFRIGLNRAQSNFFKTLWSNQWEPARKAQDAFEVYNYHFPDSENINEDIEDIPDELFGKMKADLIVGGFPCQDYSVARSKKNEMGIEGQKGVLFWQIIRATRIIKPKYLILENVDRLLKSPSKQRGRDFAVMLASFHALGYSVEWRVINAADYGRAQRRRRVYFFIYRNDTTYAKEMDKLFEPMNLEFFVEDGSQYNDYIFKNGMFAKQFPVKDVAYKSRISYYELPQDIVDVSNNFSGKVWNSGVMRHGRYFTIDTIPVSEDPIPLKNIIQSEEDVSNKFYLTDKEKLEKFNYLRGPKKINRTSANGYTYTFSEGGMSPYDDLNKPGRTMLTSEGSLNRSTHIINVDNKIRLLTPIEAERLQDFPDDWTKHKLTSSGKIKEVSDRMRMFFMGNALVIDIIKRIGTELYSIEKKEMNSIENL